MKASMYSSPHVLDVRECISVDGEDISEADMSSLLDSVRPSVEALQEEGVWCTSFEVLTAAAFLWFARCGVEVAVVEVGMGGSDDATNVIVPAVSVITNISLEHPSFLGGTISEIASRKAGIIKDGIPVFTSAKGDALKVVMDRASEKGSTVRTIVPGRMVSMDAGGSVIEYGGRTYRVGLPGSYQSENAALAVEAARAVGPEVTEEAIASGLECASIRYRMQRFDEVPMVVDGTHTVAGMKYLAEDVARIYGKAVTVFGVLSDKNIPELARIVAGMSDTVIVTSPDSERAAGTDEVFEAVRRHSDSVMAVHGLEKAMDLAVSVSGGRTILVTGSFRMAEGAIRWLETRSARYST